METDERSEAAWLQMVGMRVRLRRVVLGVPQRTLAAAAGISSVTLSSVERGGHAATVAVYRRLAVACGLTLDHLLSDDPADLPPNPGRW